MGIWNPDTQRMDARLGYRCLPGFCMDAVSRALAILDKRLIYIRSFVIERAIVPRVWKRRVL